MSSREAPKRKKLCDFCGRDRAEVDLLFRVDRGGVNPAICDGCAGKFTMAADAFRRQRIRRVLDERAAVARRKSLDLHIKQAVSEIGGWYGQTMSFAASREVPIACDVWLRGYWQKFLHFAPVSPVMTIGFDK